MRRQPPVARQDENATKVKFRVPAVVVRGDLNGLGVVRSLSHGGMDLYVVDVSRNRPAMWSRGVRQVLTPALYGRSLVDTLVALQRRLGVKPILFLTDEAAVITVAKLEDQLRHLYEFQTNSSELVERLENKARFHEFATSVGLPVPNSVIVAAHSDLPRLDELNAPFIIKPADKSLVYAGVTERIHVADNHEDAKRICARLTDTIGESIVQERIPGPDRNIVFCLFYRGAADDSFIAFTGRKLLVSPPQVGSTALCVAAPELHAQLSAITRVFVETANYRGFGGVEFKQDESAGVFYIIEPTVGRPDWQEEIATLCGVNIPLFAYETEAGLRPTRASFRNAAAWRASFNVRLKGAPRMAGLTVFDGYWRPDDPLPVLAFCMNAVAKRGGALIQPLQKLMAWARFRAVANLERTKG